MYQYFVQNGSYDIDTYNYDIRMSSVCGIKINFVEKYFKDARINSLTLDETRDVINANR